MNRIMFFITTTCCAVLTPVSFGGDIEQQHRIGGPPPRESFRTLQSDKFVPGEMYVRFDDATASDGAKMAQIHRGVGAQVLWRSRRIPGLVRVEITAGAEEAIANAYLDRSEVKYAEPNYYSLANGTPNDPFLPNLWGMLNARAVQAWDLTTGQPDFKVAVIDTGTFTEHPDLNPNLWVNPDEIPGNGIDDDSNGYTDDVFGWNVVDENGDVTPPLDCSDTNHGTHVAGTLAARGNNFQGVAGVNWQAAIVTLRTGSCCGDGTQRCRITRTVEALEYALEIGCRVSNNSYGGGSFRQVMYDMIEDGQNIGHIFVTSAGNDTLDIDQSEQYPASYDLPNIISVAAIDIIDGLAIFSNYGVNSVDLGAPGLDIFSTVDEDGYAGGWAGTSMASPHVAGAVALAMAHRPAESWQQTRDRILSSARPINSLLGRTVTGGTLDVAGAIGIDVDGLWVDLDGTNGNGSYDDPFNNLFSVINAAGSGDAIYFFPSSGVFVGTIVDRVTLRSPFGGVAIGEN